MLHGRSAKSTRSNNTEMDIEGKSELFLVVFFKYSTMLFPRKRFFFCLLCAFNFVKQNQTWVNFRDSSGSWKETGRPTVSRPGNRSASNSQQAIH